MAKTLTKLLIPALMITFLAMVPWAFAEEKKKRKIDIGVSHFPSGWVVNGNLFGEEVTQSVLSSGFGKYFRGTFFANYDHTQKEINEIDWAVEGSVPLGKNLTGSAGLTLITVPGGPNTAEFSGTLDFDGPLNLGVRYARDIDGNKGAGYTTLSVGHTIPLWKKIGLSLAGYLGINHKNYTLGENGLHNTTLEASVGIPFKSGLTLTPVLGYSNPLDNRERLLYWALTLSGSF